MKTSTKIFLGLAAVAVVWCAVNVVVNAGRYKKYDAEARRIVAELDAGHVKRLDVTLSPEIDAEASAMMRNYLKHLVTRQVSEGESRQSLYVPASILGSVRVEEGTLYIEGLVGGRRSVSTLLESPWLETVVVREAGKADEVMERNN
jgi:hypothetical protein